MKSTSQRLLQWKFLSSLDANTAIHNKEAMMNNSQKLTHCTSLFQPIAESSANLIKKHLDKLSLLLRSRIQAQRDAEFMLTPDTKTQNRHNTANTYDICGYMFAVQNFFLEE